MSPLLLGLVCPATGALAGGTESPPTDPPLLTATEALAEVFAGAGVLCAPLALPPQPATQTANTTPAAERLTNVTFRPGHALALCASLWLTISLTPDLNLPTQFSASQDLETRERRLIPHAHRYTVRDLSVAMRKSPCVARSRSPLVAS